MCIYNSAVEGETELKKTEKERGGREGGREKETITLSSRARVASDRGEVPGVLT